MQRRIDEALVAPYARVLTKDAEDGGFAAEVLEFPGCFSAGDTAEEAMANLEEAMALWVEGELEQGHEIPRPFEATEFSGQISLRVLPSMHERATLAARLEGVSLNRWLSDAISTQLGLRPRVVEYPSGGSGAGRRVAEE